MPGDNFKVDQTFQKTFFNYVKNGEFNSLICFCLEYMSVRKLANLIHCSRRSIGRYKSQVRLVPISVVKKLVEVFHLEESILIQLMTNDKTTFVNEFLPRIDQDRILWFGDNNGLINTLFVIQTKIRNISLFELSYITEIEVKRLAEYQSGRSQIAPTDIVKLMNTLKIGIMDLFPQLFSYDQGESYLPLNPLRYKIKGVTWINYYTTDDDIGGVNIIPDWPISRYDCNGKIIHNCFPNELTIDEFFNTDELFFYNKEFEFYTEPKFDINHLPPNYYRYYSLLMNGINNKENEIVKPNFISAVSIDIVHEYLIQIKMADESRIDFNVEVYSNSSSVWYQRLKDFDYFKQCKLVLLDKDKEDSQILSWPEGQYIRIDELIMDMNTDKKHFHFNFISRMQHIDNWINWC
jgi:hypothetical protein